MDRLIDRLNPRVGKNVLLLLAGAAWCGVGVMLVSFAANWLRPVEGTKLYILVAAGFVAALPIHHFGFLKIADKNITRIVAITGKRCLFSFITWRSYLIIIVMMAMGITLRHSAIPKPYLSILYNGIGGGLFLSGIRYFRKAIMGYINKPEND